MADASLYDRLGGVFAIAAVVDHFSDAVVKNPIVGQGSKNPAARRVEHERARPPAGPEVHADPVGLQRRRRTVRVRGNAARVAPPSASRRPIATSASRPSEFDEVAAELARTLDSFKVPEQEKGEVLAAFAAHKGEVTEGSMAPAAS